MKFSEKWSASEYEIKNLCGYTVIHVKVKNLNIVTITNVIL